MSLTNDKPKQLVGLAEDSKITRTLLAWLNTFPDKPVTMIKYEQLEDKTVAMALSTIQSTYIVRSYITGGHLAEYQFKIIYRVRPGSSIDARLTADELLDRFGDWLAENRPDFGEDIIITKLAPTTRSSLFAAYDNGDEDHQILFLLQYEVN